MYIYTGCTCKFNESYIDTRPSVLFLNTINNMSIISPESDKDVPPVNKADAFLDSCAPDEYSCKWGSVF